MDHGMAIRGPAEARAVLKCPHCGSDMTVAGSVGICTGHNGWYHVSRKRAGRWTITAKERIKTIAKRRETADATM